MRSAFAGVVLGALLGVAAPGARPGLAAEAADVARGADLFATKGCARCHRPAGQGGAGPALDTLRRHQGAYELAGRFWNHAPGMFTALGHEGVVWPTVTAPEMADLMAYLGGNPVRDPPPDLGRGHAVLVNKGCLKCHALHGEGGRLAPDLASARGMLEPAPTWAAAIWRHTPRMAALALEQGLLYPRFSEAEMRHLVAFLLQASAR